MDVVALAARIQAMPDDALDLLVTERQAPPQLASTFDLAEHLLTDASIALALRWRSGAELAGLAAGTSSPRLDALLLGVDGVALPPVTALAAEALDGLAASAAADAAPIDAAPTDSPTAPQLAIDEAIKIAELVHRIADHPITLRSRAQLPAAVVRDLAASIDAEPGQLDERLELASAAGLVDKHDGRLRATVDADAWLASPVPDRWLRVATAWLEATDDLSAVATGDFPLADDAVRAVRERQARQARRLGLVDGRNPTTLAAALAHDPGAARETLAAHVPPATASVYLQPDLSAVAPGPLRAAVDARLRGIARIERAGIASQWRITAQSVAAGLASGESADGVLEFLAGISLTGVPQPVAYLVRDTAARFGSLRVRSVDPTAEGGARAQVRSDDEQLIRTIAVDRALVTAGPVQTGPHRLTFRLSAEEVLEALLEERYPAVLEDEEGELVLRRPERAPRRERERHRLVARLRDAGFEVGEQERAWLERQLQSAVRERMPVRLTVTTSSEPVDVELVPLAVANGRLRARDANRDVERTLPLSAITKVAGLGVAN
ncbi:helicase-associated domain-containing protein [Agrococcus sp. Marseille-Q4369]|uniref:helicase-associated domain-containing protein n=1 Tax=Agrococcus sp. Marseille-Q4369 TaxID=2810513 RepID=UPI001B8C73E6|nr:helicase-associated domain-containing protein [Agrococcus sp. Marseille-Q4369]QUW19862.1 helicase-associated domain-containing protein [Agrococcus sp. Marseille-Q4369]